MSGWRNDIDAAPLWTEVIVRYEGSRCRIAQPRCVATSVRTEDGWDLGSMPKSKKPTHWMPLPDPPTPE